MVRGKTALVTRLRGSLGVGLLAALWVCLTVRFFTSHVLETPYGRTWAVADDLYISADFARTFAHGEGLRWYPGAPKVEGFSNPLWVMVLAVIHWMPGFSEDALGLYVLFPNLVVLILLALVFVRGLRQVADASATPPETGRYGWALALGLGAVSLTFWAATGFEVALVALFALAAFVESLREPEPSPLRVGALVALAFLTRMDGILACTAAIAVTALRLPNRRAMGKLFGIVLGTMLFVFVSRRLYYTEWLPNTYYLKATGWPLSRRLPQGLFQNGVTIAATVLLGLPFFLFASRRTESFRYVVAALAVPILTLIYSTQNGGDFSSQAFGYDRFTAVGSVFELFALAIVVLRCRVTTARSGVLGAAALLVVIGTLAADILIWDPDAVRNFFDPRKPPVVLDSFAEEFIHQGKVLEAATLPGARIAVCAAGATVYFSHRGGVDVLGKVDPYVARLPVPESAPRDARCWRSFPGVGHNKEDLPTLFLLRKPDLSIVRPPEAEKRQWVTFRVRRFQMYARAKSPFVRWDHVSKVTPLR